MEHQKILGQRIKSFRKRAGLSQMDLELEIEAAPGSLSRMESGEVNPTKETLDKIRTALNLTSREFSYLAGPLANPVSEEEVRMVEAEVKEYFSKPGVLAYVLDDRWRLLTASKSMQKLLGVSDSEVKTMYGVTLLKCMLNDSYPLFKFINNSKLEETLYLQLSRFYLELSYMEDDPYYKESMDAILKNPVSKEVWKRIVKDGPEKILPPSSREVVFSFGPMNIKMQYSREVIQKYPRFEIIEYFPTNKVIRMLSKIV